MMYFKNINCIEELKKQYFALAKRYHSDITGGSDEIMKVINSQYADLHKKYKDIHKSIKEDAKENETYTAKKPTNEAPEDFINIINFLLSLKGITVELCGRWLWIGGDTKTHKDTLKAMGCKWSNNKKMWSWHYSGDGSTYHKGRYTMEEIRNAYGSESFYKNDNLLLGAGA